MSDKKAISLWLTQVEYQWVKKEATEKGISMTAYLRSIIRKKMDDESRRPEQY